MPTTTIITNATVLTCDTSNRCGKYHLAISRGRVADISDHLDRLVKIYPDAEMLDASGKLILPGFVNPHFHGESFLLQRLTRGTHFALWNQFDPLRQAQDRLVHPSATSAIAPLYEAVYTAHIRSGTTAVGEFPPAYDERSFEEMLKGIEQSGVTTLMALQTWDHVRRARALGAKRPPVAVTLGAERDLTLYSIESALKGARELNEPLLVHTAEQRDEAEQFRRHFKKGVVGLLHSLNTLNERTILVHGNHVDEDEVALIKSAGGTVIVCPRSTAAKQTGYPALRHLARRHIRLALGTDWGSVDMLEEMRFMMQLPQVVPDLRFFSPIEIVRMATINGATALGLGKETGSIEIGKRADLVFFAVHTMRLPLPAASTTEETVARMVVESLTSGDVSDVMIGGEFVIRERTLQRRSEETVIESFRDVCGKLLPSVPTTIPVQVRTEPANILPFTADARTSQAEPPESFLSGYTPAQNTPPDAEPPKPKPHPLVNRPKVQREPIKPELPKDTRRVFGEDEDI